MALPTFNTFEWSAEMVLRSVKLVATDAEYRRLPPEFFDITKIKDIFTFSEVTQLIDATDAFRNKKKGLEELKKLREHPEFPRIIGLSGTLNGMETPANTGTHFASNRSWLYIFAVKLFNHHKAAYPNLPQCAKYVPMFEADKLAQKISDNLYITIDDKTINECVEKMHKVAEEMAGPNFAETHVIHKDVVEMYLFEVRNYYMLPEYRLCLSDVLKEGEIPITQTNELLNFKLLCMNFFSSLAKVKPFSCDPTITDKIDYTAKIESHSSLFQNTVFVKSAKNYLLNEVGQNNIDGMDSDEHDQRIMLTEIDYFDLVDEQCFTLDIMPIVITNTSLDNRVILPISSPKFELVIPTSLAFYTWVKLFTEDYESLDMMTDDKLEGIQSYINKCIDEFEPEKKTLSTIDYHKYIAMLDEWNEKKREYLKYPAEIAEIPAAAYIDFDCWMETMKKRFSAKLFPDYPNILFGVKQSFLPTPPFTKEGKWLAFLGAFPKAAKLMHNQDTCRLIAEKETDFCALDMVFDGSVQESDRCNIILENIFIEAIKKARAQKVAGKQDVKVSKDTGLAGFKRGFLNKPSQKQNFPSSEPGIDSPMEGSKLETDKKNPDGQTK